MKKTIIILGLLAPVFTFAQLQISGYAIQQMGMESNPLRTPPALLEEEEEEFESEIFIPRPFVSYSKIYLKARKKWENLELSIRPRASYFFFPELTEANYFRADVEQQLLYKPNKQWKIYQKAFGGTRMRPGDEWDEELVSLPRSYHRLSLSAGTEYRPNRKWIIQLEGKYLHQNFVDEEREVNYYKALEGEIEIKRRFQKNSFVKEASLQTVLQNRHWFRSVEIDSLEEFRVDITPMWNGNIQGGITLQASPNLELEPFVRLGWRSTPKSSQQWNSQSVGLGINWELKKLSIKWINSFSNKTFPNFSSEDFDDEKLTYSYFKSDFSLDYFLTKKSSILLNVRSNRRISNFQEEEEPSFGAFSNVYIGLGGKLKF